MLLSFTVTPVECIVKDAVFDDGLIGKVKGLDVNEISISKSKSMNGTIYPSSEDEKESSGIGSSVSLSGASSLGESMFHIRVSQTKDSSSKDSMQSASSGSDVSKSPSSQSGSMKSSSSQNDSLKSASSQADSLESFSTLSDSSNHLVPNSSKTVARLEERAILNSVGFSDATPQLTAREFKELAAHTGFLFGDNFNLIDHAWYTENKSVVRLRIPDSIQNELQKYIIHPCIIDACMQARIPIPLKDPNAKKIPIGKCSYKTRAYFCSIFCSTHHFKVGSDCRQM